MKIKKIAAVCKARCMARLMDYTDSDGVVHQWISTGHSAYPVEGLPYLTEEHMATVLDLGEKQLKNMVISHDAAPASLDFRDAADNETQMREEAFSVVYSGKVYQPYTVRGETQFVDFELLTPIVTEYKDVELWLREMPGGGRYFAAKAGLLCVALILPTGNMDKLAQALESVGASYRSDKA